MRAVVTGGAGFIGSHLVELFIEQGHDVHVIDNLVSGKKEQLHPDAHLYEADITDPQVISLAAGIKPDAIVHLAAQADVSRSLANPVYDLQVNTIGTLHMLEACLLAKTATLLLASSSAVYGMPPALQASSKWNITEETSTEPTSCYGLSKLMAERYVELYAKLYGIPGLVLRFANVYGPRQLPKGDGGVIAMYAKRICEGQSIRIHGDGGQTRDFIYVKDVAEASLLALVSNLTGTYHVCTGDAISILALTDRLEHLLGQSIKREYAPSRNGDIRHSRLSPLKLVDALGWTASTSFDEGLRQTLQSWGLSTI
ncbi:NAD-dependent epimerase/dehydratase family protein [Paenibacillus sp. 1001270B_150601_E10]|uniref:NAD-dependent epimerase/dehydratase family protein n=1 Tax=Paenibacillus sp. 1001270B_150601_E10 TaxID=2787079 RepID=UPI0018A11349|nr:NAD-dependent epimerase/dehydratase family protein [Paenibacillus sp. 1001270B_150601_E10]